MQPQQPAGYDQTSTMFSPEGRIFQVNYAQEAVRKGTTVIALRCSDGVVLLAIHRMYSRLVEPDTMDKIHQLDEHIGGITTGVIADGRVLVDIARWEAQRQRFIRDTPITIQELADELGEYLTAHTQYGGTRPYGCALLIAGMDKHGSRVVVADPSGALYEYHAAVRGHGQDTAREYLLEHHDPQRGVDKSVIVGIKALLATYADEEVPSIKIATVRGEPPRFKKPGDDEIEKLVGVARKEYSGEGGV